MKLIKSLALSGVALSSVACFTFVGGAVFASASNSRFTDPSTTAGASLSQTQQTDLSNLKTKGVAEINRRLASLNTAKTKISSSTKLSSTDKSYLNTEVATEVSGLTALETKLDAETTLTGARADVQSIFNDYRVYALILPKLWLVTTADGEQNTDAKLTTLSTQLQAQITTDQNAGKDVSSEQTKLNDMETQTKNAQAIASAMETNVLNLQPSDYNSDHTLLSGDQTQLKTAQSDNQAAYADGKAIVADLKNL